MEMENKWDVPTCANVKLPAPHKLLKIIRCGSKIECTTQCTYITCGLKCTSVHTGYRGVSKLRPWRLGFESGCFRKFLFCLKVY